MAKNCWHCGEKIWFKNGSWVAIDPPAYETSEHAFNAIPLDKRHDSLHNQTCSVLAKWNEFDKKEASA